MMARSGREVTSFTEPRATGPIDMMYAHYVPGLPGALIYELSGAGIRQLAYEDTDQYQLTKGFLADPQTFLEMLFAKPPKG